jgi:predicted SAM-dependent methyltransferase
VALAGDLQRLASVRAGLRQRVLASPIFDAERFAGHFEDALRDMWKHWCRTQAESSRTPTANILTRPMSPRMSAMKKSLRSITVSSPMNGTVSVSADLMKLHIGGKEPKAGWRILNALDFDGVDFVGDVCDLSLFPDECCEKVYASHVMEHVGQRDFVNTLKGIHRILCKGGEFYFSVPDLEVLCRLFLSPELDASGRFHVMRMMFGGQIDDYDFHYIGLTHEFMMDFFQQAGFSNVKRVTSFELFNDTSDFKPYGVPISLNLIATK